MNFHPSTCSHQAFVATGSALASSVCEMYPGRIARAGGRFGADLCLAAGRLRAPILVVFLADFLVAIRISPYGISGAGMTTIRLQRYAITARKTSADPSRSELICGRSYEVWPLWSADASPSGPSACRHDVHVTGRRGRVPGDVVVPVL